MIPKVRPIVIPLILDSVQDFQRLEHAAQATKRYLFRSRHSLNRFTSDQSFFLSAYTTRRYTDGVWPYNLLPYGLPYVSLCKSNTFLDSYFLQESLKFDQFCFVHIYSLFS